MKSPRELVSEFLYGDPKAYESKALMWNKQTHVVSAADVEELVRTAIDAPKIEAFVAATDKYLAQRSSQE
jgi:hypothetical protein